jgi:hypothetical protein
VYVYLCLDRDKLTINNNCVTNSRYDIINFTACKLILINYIVMKFILLITLFLSFFILSCSDNEPTEVLMEEIVIPLAFQNKGHELVYNMVQKVGDYNTLKKLKNVVYTYTYETPTGQKDVSTEKYIFEGELSYGNYKTHQRTLSDLEGEIEQGYDGEEYWLKHDGVILNDSIRLKRVAFNRPTNFYWFTMFQKLLDPGLNYEFIGEVLIEEVGYDIVKVSFNSDDDKPTDIYQLYINKKTGLVDQFLFTVADFGKIEIPFLMEVDYDKIDDMLIPSKRRYKKSTWNADVSEEPWTVVTWSDIKFSTNLLDSDFQK